MANNQLEFDIFLSYNWDHKAHVEKLYAKLKKLNFTVWMDKKELNINPMMDQLANGIIKSRLFMCCVKKEFSVSDNCKSELSFARAKQKPMIILMIDHYNNIASGVQFTVDPATRQHRAKNSSHVYLRTMFNLYLYLFKGLAATTTCLQLIVL